MSAPLVMEIDVYYFIMTLLYVFEIFLIITDCLILSVMWDEYRVGETIVGAYMALAFIGLTIFTTTAIINGHRSHACAEGEIYRYGRSDQIGHCEALSGVRY